MVTNTTLTTELVETGERRDRIGRRITPAARRGELVEAWRVSGLTQAEFARREGIICSSLRRGFRIGSYGEGDQRAGLPSAGCLRSAA